MKKLYYATFEKGFDLIVEKFIKKFDKNSKLKKMYTDSVIFFADEHFSFSNNLFTSAYLVLDNTCKEGACAMNAEMKHLLEKKDFKIYVPKNVKKIKLSYVYASEKMKIDSKLKNAFETMLMKLTKKHFSFYETDMELALIAKDDGECMFVKNITPKRDFVHQYSKSEITPETAYAMNFLSNPAEKEVSLDPFSDYGMISYVRSLCFKKANVIANEEDSTKLNEIKKRSKLLKDKSFSVMNYNFLSESFPIKFIDKIVTVLPENRETQIKFFEKANKLNVREIVVYVSKFTDVNYVSRELYNITEQYNIIKGKILKLEIIR